MSKVLLVLCHPNFKDSFANKIIVEKLKTLVPDIEIDNIYELYPAGKIDVKGEQEKLLKADSIIFQFPMFWFKSPYLLSKWFEDVFAHGFAYGSSAYKLEGKKFIVRPSENYQESKNLYRNAKKYIGKMLTVKYQEMTNDNIPRFPVGVGIRDYE